MKGDLPQRVECGETMFSNLLKHAMLATDLVRKWDMSYRNEPCLVLGEEDSLVYREQETCKPQTKPKPFESMGSDPQNCCIAVFTARSVYFEL